MSGYLSNLLTNTTSRYNTLRRTLLNNEDDGATEDDSHISRVLRAYYTEKGQPFPPWLPPDPNDRRAITSQSYGQQQQGGYLTSAGGRSQYGSVQAQNAAGNRGSLSDLWDTPANNTAPAAPQSLRAGRRAPGGARPDPSSSLAPPTQARPLPSQREGSYQSFQSQSSARPEPSPPNSSAGGGGGSTAQERLKQRLWGGARAGSPSNSMMNSGGGSQGQSAYGQPQGGNNSYDTGSGRRYGR